MILDEDESYIDNLREVQKLGEALQRISHTTDFKLLYNHFVAKQTNELGLALYGVTPEAKQANIEKLTAISFFATWIKSSIEDGIAANTELNQRTRGE